MDEVMTAPNVTHVRDRRAGLVVLGVAQILIGLICAGLALGVAASAEIATRRGIPGAGATAASGMVLWGLACVYFIVTGIGSMRARRWAQALSVSVSAVWLAGGVVTTLMMAILLPRAIRQNPSADATSAAGVTAITTLLAFVLVPLGLFLFYRSAATRLTCERIDSKRRWTDRVPRPVLAVIVVMGFISVALIANVGNPVMPFMGTVVTGPPAALTFFGLAVLCAFVAVQLYRLKENAWWTLVLLQIAGLIVGLFTLMRSTGRTEVSVPDVYREPLFVALVIATWLAYFAFLLYLRRFFAIRLLPRTRRDD